MKRKSNQRITKIKIDKIEELLKKAESTSVENATVVQPLGADLVPYPDMTNLRKWTHDYLLSGLTKIFPVYRSEDGQQYFTALIDGLPLFTKMTKSFKTIEISGDTILNSDLITTTGSPTITDDFIYSTESKTDYISFAESNIKVGSEIVLKFTTNDTIINSSQQQYLCFLQDPFSIQIPSGESKLAAWTGQWSYVTNENLQPNTTYYIKTVINSVTSGALSCSTSVSTDGITYSNEVTHSNINSLPGSPYIIGTATGSSTTQTYAPVKLDLTGCYVLVDGVKSGFTTTGSSTEVVETSKPGLWLSNFITTVSESSSGSWLRHNLIHSDEDSYQTINADTIGNYSYSFIQRGMFFRTADGGSWNASCTYNTAQDIYNIQWLPGNLSSIAYKTLDNPGPRFGSVYSTYQTIITPDNPDMQRYQEGNTKCLSFKHIDPFNENSTTNFSSKLVGKDWTYEIKFKGNGTGSGNDYGSGSTPDSPNGSNGACITGTISYTILDSEGNETTCTQEVNSCYKTPQTVSNSNVPDNDDNIIDDNSIGIKHIYGSFIGCCEPCIDETISGSYYLHISFLNINSSCTATKTGSSSIADVYTTYYSACGIGGTHRQLSHSNREAASATLTCSGGQWCGSYYGGISYTFIPESTGKQPQSNVNLYLNITDLKAEAEAKGLTYNNSSCQTRFTYNLSTSRCTDSWCTSRLVAEDVNINELGDISSLTDQTIKG